MPCRKHSNVEVCLQSDVLPALPEQDTAAAMKVIQLAVADKASVAAATQLASAVRTAAITAFGSSLPESLSTAASHLDVASLVQDPSVQSAAVPVLQAAAAAAGNSWDGAALVRSSATRVFPNWTTPR